LENELFAMSYNSEGLFNTSYKKHYLSTSSAMSFKTLTDLG